MWRALYSPFVWVAFIFVVFVPLNLLGLITVPLAVLTGGYYCRHDQEKQDKGEDPKVFHFTSPFMWIWDNFEDGIANTTYFKHPSFLWQVMKWSCFRNPVNNLRIAPYLSCKVDPKKICFVGTYGSHYELDLIRVANDIKKYRNKEEPHWYFAWHGFYTCLFWQHSWFGGKLRRFWLGWKIVPTDVFGVSSARAPGAKFAQQWRNMN